MMSTTTVKLSKPAFSFKVWAITLAILVLAWAIVGASQRIWYGETESILLEYTSMLLSFAMLGMVGLLVARVLLTVLPFVFSRLFKFEPIELDLNGREVKPQGTAAVAPSKVEVIPEIEVPTRKQEIQWQDPIVARLSNRIRDYKAILEKVDLETENLNKILPELQTRLTIISQIIGSLVARIKELRQTNDAYTALAEILHQDLSAQAPDRPGYATLRQVKIQQALARIKDRAIATSLEALIGGGIPEQGEALTLISAQALSLEEVLMGYASLLGACAKELSDAQLATHKKALDFQGMSAYAGMVSFERQMILAIGAVDEVKNLAARNYSRANVLLDAPATLMFGGVQQRASLATGAEAGN